jgi:hypothetical protein
VLTDPHLTLKWLVVDRTLRPEGHHFNPDVQFERFERVDKMEEK